MSISTAAVLVELNISVWTANKLDRAETNEVNQKNAAAANAAKVHKYLMAGTTQQSAIAKHAAQTRAFHLANTLAWADKGPRLLPTKNMVNYKQQMNDFMDTYNDLTEEFLRDYPVLVQQVQNQVTGLGMMFNPNDYPDVPTLRRKFGMRLVFSPLPSSGDFRLDIPQEDLNDMRQSYEENFDSRLKDAMQESWDRLFNMMKGISTKLTDVEGEDKRYHDSLLTNPRELCDLLKALNVTNDPKLEDARAELEYALSGVDIEGIRDSAEQRADVKARVDNILRDFW